MAYSLQTNIMSLILLYGAMFYMYGSKQIPNTKTYAIRLVIINTIAMCLSDMISAGCSGKTFTGARQLMMISSIVYYEAVIGVCLAWYDYVNLSLGVTRGKSRALVITPFVIITLLTLLTPITGYMFTIDGRNMYARSSGIWLHWLVAWGYLIAASGKVLWRIKNAKSKVQRERLRPLFDFIILPVAASVCQMLFYGVSAMQCGVAISIVLILAREMNERIQKDALTGLNNRGALDAYIAEIFEKGAKNLSFFMLDIDDFKEINDKYGHHEGDRAIQLVADELKKLCGSCGKSLFLCRYGGDEFVIIGSDITPEDEAFILSEINRRAQDVSRNDFTCAALSISTGNVSGLCTCVEDAEILMENADKKMYRIKHKKSSAV